MVEGWRGGWRCVPVCGVQCSLVAVLGVRMPEVGAAGALVSGASSSVMVAAVGVGCWLLCAVVFGGLGWVEVVGLVV